MTRGFNALMTHDVTVLQLDSDFTGSHTTLNTFQEKGFVEYDQHRGLNNDGEQIDINGIVYLKNDTNFDENHPTWSIQHNNRTMRVVNVARIDHPITGETHHYELKVV
jgi:hypothetical protein